MNKFLEKCNTKYFTYKDTTYKGYVLHHRLYPSDTDYVRYESYIVLCTELNCIFNVETTEYRSGNGNSEEVCIIWNFNSSE